MEAIIGAAVGAIIAGGAMLLNAYITSKKQRKGKKELMKYVF